MSERCNEAEEQALAFDAMESAWARRGVVPMGLVVEGTFYPYVEVQDLPSGTILFKIADGTG